MKANPQQPPAASSGITEPPPAVEVGANDMVGPGAIFCPNPRMTLWSAHPKVFLDIGTTGQTKCPYCGTVYRLKAGERIHAH